MPLPAGRLHTKLHANATAAPHNIARGIITLWLTVPERKRATCGTAKPINATGPQNAVTVAPSTPVITRIFKRALLTGTPRLRAYPSPSNIMFNGLIINAEPTSPAVITAANKGNIPEETPPKFPIPQKTYKCTPSTVAKELSRLIKADVT